MNTKRVAMFLDFESLSFKKNWAIKIMHLVFTVSRWQKSHLVSLKYRSQYINIFLSFIAKYFRCNNLHQYTIFCCKNWQLKLCEQVSGSVL